MQIVYIASEMEPYCKVGGLGDVIGALPERIVKKGPRVKVIIPAYGIIQKNDYEIENNIDIYDIEIGDKQYNTQIHKLLHNSGDYEILMIGSEEFFSRQGIYTDESGEVY